MKTPKEQVIEYVEKRYQGVNEFGSIYNNNFKK